MVRIVPLLRSDSLSICRFDHPREHDDRFVERVADVYAASFVESGEYLLEIDEGRWRLKAGDVRIFHPGMRYRATSVEERFNDVGLTLNYLSAEADEFDPDLTWARSQQPVLRATNRLRYLHWGIDRALRANLSLLAESWASELFREIPESSSHRANLYGARKLDWYAERVHHAKEMLQTHYDRDHRLCDLARSAGMSPFHFARVFKELIAETPHACLITARLSAAAGMLREGRGVTETCFACGFANLSYFSRLFARRFGMSPSRYSRTTKNGKKVQAPAVRNA
jgi:AraC-like DNA-binding protein